MDETVGSAVEPPAPGTEDLDERARRMRLDLRELHDQRSADDDVSEEAAREIIALTDDVLDIEHGAADRREAEAHRRDSTVVYACTGTSAAVCAALLVLGLMLGRLGGGGITLVVTGLAIGLAMAGVHRLAERPGHRRRRHHAVVAAALGVATAAIAFWSTPPWWLGAVLLAAAIVNTVAFVLTVAIRGGELDG